MNSRFTSASLLRPSEISRENWSPGGGDAHLFYVIYGDIDFCAPLEPARYRTSGLPPGLEMQSLTRGRHAAYMKLFEEGYPWSHLTETNRALARDVERSRGCVILQGTVRDPSTLEYLRDAIGFITFLLDRGGVAVYDAQILTWWAPSQWRREVFEPAAPEPFRHVVILYSSGDEESGGTWFHTRGMRKFGRPDISVRGVPPKQFNAVADLCSRFIAHQASGALVPEGQEVHVNGLERAGVVRHRYDYDDPHFNNVHFEIEWIGDA